MKVGTIIKDARRAKGLNQQELSKGICTQATISNVESNRSMPNVQTLKLIADRLTIDFGELMSYMSEKSEQKEMLQLAKVSLKKKDYEKTKKILIENLKISELSSSELKEYYYYFGMAELLGNSNFQDAMYHFNLGLQQVVKI